MADPFDNDKAFEKVLVGSLEAELMPPGRHCPHPGTISAYFERRLSESESRDCERHVSSCASCQKQLAALVQIDPSGPEAEPEPAGREPRWRWTWTASAALAATAVLAIVVTARFRPLMEEASRLAGETRQSKQQPESAVAPFPQPAPTAAADATARSAEPLLPAPMPAAPSTSMPLDAASPSGDRHGAAAPQSKAAPALEAPRAVVEPTSPPSPAVAAAPAIVERSDRPPTSVERFAADGLSRARPETRGAVPAPPRREESAAPLDAGPVIVASRSNRDVLWRIAGNEVERSEDGGKTWVARPAGTSAKWTAASSPSPEICWVVGHGGAILRTTDGKEWEKIASPTEEDLAQVTAFGPSEATVGSSSGRRFATHDGGKTWSPR